jgi:hypothetical protein
MKKLLFTAICLSVLFLACGQGTDAGRGAGAHINPSGTTIETRFNVPPGYERIRAESNSFGRYLRQLPLKPHGESVLYYNGKVKPDRGVYDAVVALDIGTRDLHQCADAVIRLRAEYLYARQLYDQISFHFSSGFRADYSKWMQGRRIVVKGNNNVYWTASGKASNTYRDFWKYMEIVFAYANTWSLQQEMKPAKVSQLGIGDVFVQGGSPGHAVIVVDVAVHPQSGKKVFLLAQSYMPAQETQVLKNPNNAQLSPWYEADFDDVLHTPEWRFRSSNLRRFGG